MTAPKRSSAAVELFGILLFFVSFIAFEWIMLDVFGWKIAALPVLTLFAALGYNLGWPPVDGNAGTVRERAGADYVVRLDPDDPDAGLPRRGA